MTRRRTRTMRALLHAVPDGGAMIEFALIMPFLALLLVGLCDLGLGLYGAMQVQAAAEAGAQYAALKYPAAVWDQTATNAISAAVTAATGEGDISANPVPRKICGCPDGGTFAPTACGSTCPSGSQAGTYASVSAQLQYTTILPYPGLRNPVILTGQAYRRLR